MKGFKRKIILDFDYNQVKEGVPKVNDQMRILNAEYRATQAEVKATGNSYDFFAAKQTKLQNEIKIAKERLEENTEKLAIANQTHGEGSKQVEQYSKEVAIGSAKLKELTAALDKTNQDLEKHKLVLGKTSEEWSKLSEKTTAIGKDLSLKVTAPIVAMGGVAFKMASDHEQALGKVDVVFENSSNHIKQWADNSLKNFGLASTTAIGMAGDFGAMFKGMDISAAKTRDWSMELTERVMDMSNFYDTTVDETINALNAIVTGQTEPLRRFGINMTQATLQEYAYSQGIQKKIADMDEAEKVQLRYNFVMERTAIAVGTTARESSSATGMMNRLKETTKELGESFGTLLLPVIVPILESINNLLSFINELDDGTKKFIITVLGIAAAVGPLLILLGKVFESFSRINDGIGAVSKIGSAFSGLLDNTKFLGFLKWAAIISVVVGLLYLLISALNDMMGKASSAERVFNNIGGAAGGLTGQLANAEMQINQSTTRGYAVGSNYVERDQEARIHEGEAIIPKEFNPWNPSATSPFGFGGGATINLNVKMNEVDDVYKLVNVIKQVPQVVNSGLEFA